MHSVDYVCRSGTADTLEVVAAAPSAPPPPVSHAGRVSGLRRGAPASGPPPLRRMRLCGTVVVCAGLRLEVRDPLRARSCLHASRSATSRTCHGGARCCPMVVPWPASHHSRLAPGGSCTACARSGPWPPTTVPDPLALLLLSSPASRPALGRDVDMGWQLRANCGASSESASADFRGAAASFLVRGWAQRAPRHSWSGRA